MTYKKMPALRIGNWKADIPIVQGGMGVGISLSGLASAVANAGLAQTKNRSGLNWFLLSLLLGPIATFIIVVTESLPKKNLR